MPTTTTTSQSNYLNQNLPSQLQNEIWGGLIGAGSQMVWPGGNFREAPLYGGDRSAPTQPLMEQYFNSAAGNRAPDYSGVLYQGQDLYDQAHGGIRDPNQINFQTNYNPQVGSLQFKDPFTGYNGGQGMQVSAPGGVGGSASDYRTAVDQVNAPTPISYDRIGGLPQIQGPNLQNYQMSGPERVQAPGGLSSFDIDSAPSVQAGTVGTQSFTQPGTASQFMSPYMQNVLDVQKSAAQRDYDQQLTQIHSDAAKTGNFGGSRQAIMDATANRDLQDRMANIQATGQQQAFQQAQQQFNQEQGIGLQAGLANQQTGLQAGLANQGMQQQTALANQQARLAAQGLGTNAGLQAALANQQAGLNTNSQNLQALLQTQGLGATLGQQGQMANQQMSYQQQLANQQAGLQSGMFNNQQAMQAQLANQQANLQAGLNATNLGFQGATFNAGQGMQAQLANQAAQQQQFQRQFGALGQQYQGGLGAAMQEQQLGFQGNQFGAGLGLQAQNAQEQARAAAQQGNLGYLGFMGQQNQNLGNWQTQGFNNNLANTAMQGAAGATQQGLAQNQADRDYAYWQYQQNFPYQQLDWLSNLASRMPAQGATQGGEMGQQQQHTPDPSWLNIVGGLAATGIGAFTGGMGAGLGKGLVS